MARITVLGGTGYAGSRIAHEAAARGHAVTSFSRTMPASPLPEVNYVLGSALDLNAVAEAISGADVVVISLAPTGDLEGRFPKTVLDIAEVARTAGARLGVVGGAGTLLMTPEGPAVADAPEYPPAYREFSVAADGVLQGLRASDETIDWFVLTPASEFGAYAPGEALGRYRVGTDVLLKDDEDHSQISGVDFASAFVDEVDEPVHHRSRFTVAY